ITTKNRSVLWMCGRLMLPGSHLMRMTYGPGLLGSPNSTACSLVPAELRTHLISPGGTTNTAFGSTSAWLVVMKAAAAPATRQNLLNPVFMLPPPGGRRPLSLQATVAHREVL